MSATKFLRNLLERRPILNKIAVTSYLMLEGYSPILLEYQLKPVPRYGYGKPSHSRLEEIIGKNRNAYKAELEKFLEFKNFFWEIPLEKRNERCEPYWMNKWIPGLDAVALYSFLCMQNPERYYEVGSGNSTAFARKAIGDHNLKTKIVSIDPHPRTQIDSICDGVIRRPLEEVDLGVFDELKKNDILFVDGSHRVFMNSDATVAFLDVLPRLEAGVLVEFHDIFLPYDYPPEWSGWFFSEQYLLAASLLAKANTFEIVLPNAFISNDPELYRVLAPIWADRNMFIVKKRGQFRGSSFWIRTNKQ